MLTHLILTFIISTIVLSAISTMMKYSNLGETTSCHILYLTDSRFFGMKRHNGLALIAKSMHCFWNSEEKWWVNTHMKTIHPSFCKDRHCNAAAMQVTKQNDRRDLRKGERLHRGTKSRASTKNGNVKEFDMGLHACMHSSQIPSLHRPSLMQELVHTVTASLPSAAGKPPDKLCLAHTHTHIILTNTSSTNLVAQSFFLLLLKTPQQETAVLSKHSLTNGVPAQC